MSQCKSCGAEITWIKTPQGKPCPLDTNPKSVWVQTKEGWRLTKGYESHFSTCPHANQHRKG